MLTPTQIAAESQSPALTDVQVLNLLLLVKAFPAYIANLGLFPGLKDNLVAEQTTPTVNTQVLKAVLTALDALPSEVVESQGRSDAPSHFTTPDNWHSLALDVLNLFYSVPADLVSRQAFALAYPKLGNLMNDQVDYRDTLRQSLIRLPGDNRRIL